MTAVWGLDSRLLFTLLVALVAAERGVEVWLAGRNARRLRARGGVEAGAEHYPLMVALHATFLPAAVAEVWLLGRPFLPALAAVSAALLALTMALRYWVVATLGERWTTRVICLPGAPAVTSGPYRWLRHPNYLAVVVELAALPLVHTAWLTAVVWGAGNAALLRRRIRVEEEALARAAGDGGRAASSRPRLAGAGQAVAATPELPGRQA